MAKRASGRSSTTAAQSAPRSHDMKKPTKRYCGMCDKWFGSRVLECPKCGADTDKAEPEPRLPQKPDAAECGVRREADEVE